MATPTPFGKYVLLERIAAGGMAEIYKARLEGIEGFHRTLAIKRILPHLAANPEFIDMLVDEAKIAGLLSHANIVQILDLGQVGDQFYIAMEYVQGRDLGQILARAAARGQRIPVRHALHVVAEVLKGLEYAHDRQVMRGTRTIPLAIVHRDISPANVLVSLHGEVKVTDFGIAKASVKAMETVAGVVKGRFDYMSPEQSTGARVDRRADLFAAGVVLYELLTGAHPFRQSSETATIDAIRRGSFTPPSRLNPEVTPELDGILARALRTDPEARYAAAGAFRDAIERVAQAAGYVNTGPQLGALVRQLFQDESPAPPPAPPAPPVVDEDEISLDEETGADTHVGAGRDTRPFVRPRAPGAATGAPRPSHGGATMPLGQPPAARARGTGVHELAPPTEYTTGISALPVADTGKFGPVAGLQDESTYIRGGLANAWADAETVIKPDPTRKPAAPLPAHVAPAAPAPAAPAAPPPAAPAAPPTPAARPPRGLTAAMAPRDPPPAATPAPASAAPAAAPTTPPPVAPVPDPVVASPPPPARPSVPHHALAPPASPAPTPRVAPPATETAAPRTVHATPWHVHGLWAVATLTAALLGMAAGAKIVRARSTSAEAPPVLQVLAPAGALSVDGAPISGTSPHQVQLRADTPARVTFKPTDAPAWEATVTLRANELRILDLTNGATR